MVQKRSRRKNHYIPKFYLKNFANEDGKIYQYDKSQERWLCRDVGNVGYKQGFYTDTTEDYLGEVENRAAKIIEYILSNERKGFRANFFYPIEAQQLSEFVVKAYERSPKFRSELYKIETAIDRVPIPVQERAYKKELFSYPNRYLDYILGLGDNLARTGVIILMKSPDTLITGDTFVYLFPSPISYICYMPISSNLGALFLSDSKLIHIIKNNRGFYRHLLCMFNCYIYSQSREVYSREPIDVSRISNYKEESYSYLTVARYKDRSGLVVGRQRGYYLNEQTFRKYYPTAIGYNLIPVDKILES